MSLPIHAQRDLENMLEQKKDVDLRIEFLSDFKETIRNNDKKVEEINLQLFSLLKKKNEIREWLQEYGIKEGAS